MARWVFTTFQTLPEYRCWIEGGPRRDWAVNYAHRGRVFFQATHGEVVPVTAPLVWFTTPQCRYDYGIPKGQRGTWEHRFVGVRNEPGDRWLRRGLWPKDPAAACFPVRSGGAVRSAFDMVIWRLGMRGRVPQARAAFDELLEVICRERRAGQDAPANPRLEAFLREWEASLRENLEIRRVAARHGFEPSALSHAFQRAHGLSPQAWREARRMESAAERLMSRSETVAEVARACGFGDPYYFSRRFKKWSGLSPLAFRRRR